MAKVESNFKNMLLSLVVITLVASALLGLVFNSTSEPIANAQLAKVNNAIKEVLPAFDNQPVETMQTVEVDGGELTIYRATQNDSLVGTAIKTFTKNGFGGMFELMVGFLPDGTINKIAVISHKETPGLGDKINPSKSNFSVQFEGKNPASFKLNVKKDNGDVDAITASTISSRAYCDAVQRAYDVLMKGGKQ